MGNINVGKILKDRLIYNIGDGIPNKPHNKPNMMHIDDVKAKIKEIVELVIDKCAEEVEINPIYEPNCDDHTPYWGKCISCGRYDNPDILVGSSVDKQSILSIKDKIKYE